MSWPTTTVLSVAFICIALVWAFAILLRHKRAKILLANPRLTNYREGGAAVHLDLASDESEEA